MSADVVTLAYSGGGMPLNLSTDATWNVQPFAQTCEGSAQAVQSDHYSRCFACFPVRNAWVNDMPRCASWTAKNPLVVPWELK